MQANGQPPVLGFWQPDCPVEHMGKLHSPALGSIGKESMSLEKLTRLPAAPLPFHCRPKKKPPSQFLLKFKTEATPPDLWEQRVSCLN